LIITKDIVCCTIKEFILLNREEPTTQDLIDLISIRYFRGKPLAGVHIRQFRDVIFNETQRGGVLTEKVTTTFNIAGNQE